MQFYPTLVSLHIVFAGIWMIFFAADIILKTQIRNSQAGETKNKLIKLYLQFSNLFGIVGSVGISLSGIILVLLNPGYGFFDMSHAHWLATKQILFVIILLITFLKLIPESKNLNSLIEKRDDDGIDGKYNSITKLNFLITIIVILNFIFAITHRFYG